MEEQKKNSILIVDDEKFNIMALAHILSPDHVIYISKDGQDAIDIAHENKPDVILLDILMPGMDGYEVLRELKRSEVTRDIPVIFISGLNGAEDEQKGLSLGAADYICKPFHPAIVELRVMNQIRLINQMRELLAKELAIQSSHAKDEFLSRMSHEMRTPMNAIIGMTRLARNVDDLSKKDEYLDKAFDASKDLLKLIDSVLGVTEIENHELTLESTEFCFESALRELTAVTDAEIKQKELSLSVSLDPSIPETLIGDQNRLFQVISILLSNAIKFTPKQGNIKLTAFAQQSENETITLQVEVIDDGIGMTIDQQNKLFTLFEQADGGINRKYGGIGSGLYIAKHIANMMGGDIKVESGLKKGSKFTFTAELKTAMPGVSNDVLSLKGKTALFADDVEINREIGIAMLEGTQIDIECAANGREALDMYVSDPDKYDIIIMDINMPEMNGVEATRSIRGLSAPKSKDVPIIAMTANILPEEVDNYLKAGMSDHIGKPVDPDILMRILGKHLKVS